MGSGQLLWLTSREITLRTRLRFTASCLLDLPFGRGVRYFGGRFRSDNNLGLLLLPTYVEEMIAIRNALRSHGLNVSTPWVLDLGANVGQFAVTAVAMLNAQVISFEPNPHLARYLTSNRRPYEGV